MAPRHFNKDARAGNKENGSQNHRSEKSPHNRRPTKTSRGSKDDERIIFTRENINSHLVSYTENPGKYKLHGLLTYLFKEFKESPAELLAKLKILNMRKKNMKDLGSIQKNILNHIFVVFNMKEDFFTNLFSLIRLEGFLSSLASDFYFKIPMDVDDFKEHFSEIFTKLTHILQSKSSMPFDSFKKSVELLSTADDLESAISSGTESASLVNEAEESEHASEDSGDSDDRAMPSIMNIGAIEELAPDDADTSDFSLVSLHDDEKIARLDRELGRIFGGDVVSDEDKTFSLVLVNALETLIRNNHIYDMSLLLNLFFLSQFSELFPASKYLVKNFITKFSDKKSISSLFQCAALAVPHIYTLYGTIEQDCGDDFNATGIIKMAINHGHGQLLVNRIKPVAFYDMYTTGLPPRYNAFLILLLSQERDLDILRKLLISVTDQETVKFVETRVAQVEKRNKAARRDKTKNKKAKEEQNNAETATGKSEYQLDAGAVVSVRQSRSGVEKSTESVKAMEPKRKRKCDEQSEASTEQPTKAAEAVETVEPKHKKTFSEKIGKRLFEERKEKTREFRMKNLKQRTKYKRETKRNIKEEGERGSQRPKITKKTIRDEQASIAKKKRKTQ